MKKNSTTNFFRQHSLFFLFLGLTILASCRVDLLDPTQTPPPAKSVNGWSRIYGGLYADTANKIVYLPDQGAVVIGNSRSFSWQNKNEDSIMVLRLDKYGDKVWGRIFGSLESDTTNAYQNKGVAICALSSGGYMLTGITQSCGDPSWGDIYIAKLNEQDGSCAWQKRLGIKNITESPCFIKETKNGVIIGATWNDNATYSWYSLIKLTANGDILWQKNYQRSSKFDVLCSLDVTDDEYILTGKILNGTNYDIFIVKIKGANSGAEEGAIEWQKQIAREKYDQANVVLKTSTGYIVGGFSTRVAAPNDRDGWIIDLDGSGNRVWELIMGDSTINEEVYSIQEVKDAEGSGAGYLVLGNAWNTDYETWIVRLNTFGNIQWQKKYGGIEKDWGLDLVKKDINNYLIAGFTANTPKDSFSEGEFWVFNIDANGASNQPNANFNFSSSFITDASTVYSVPNPTFAPANITVGAADFVVVNDTYKVIWSDPTNLSILEIPWPTPTSTPTPK